MFKETTYTEILVAKSQTGDKVAFAQLMRRYRGRVLALCLHLTGSEQDAEDATQEVFLSAFRSIHRFQGRSHFFTWLYRMAVNRSLNTCRKRKRCREISSEDPRIERALAVDGDGNPIRIAQLRRTYRRLLGALDQLPSAMRTSVVLVTLQGLSYHEAATIQHCAPGTIAWHIHEARKRLAQKMRITPKTPSRLERALSSELIALLTDYGLPVPT